MSSAPPPRVLLADPDPEIRRLYHEGFQHAGCDVVEASDGRAALTTAFVRRPSLIVTELTLPVIDGVALCEILRLDGMTANVPIIVTAAGIGPADRDRAPRAGADVVLAKPTPLEMLVIEARRLLPSPYLLREPWASAATHAAEPTHRAMPGRAGAGARPRRLSTTQARFVTTAPPVPPPALLCPFCDRPLTYWQSQIGGVRRTTPSNRTTLAVRSAASSNIGIGHVE